MSAAADAERERLRATFDRAAATYQAARPDYPDEMYAHLLAVTGVVAGDRVLEVGCASGKATAALARLGLRVTALELGPALAAAARANLAPFRDVDVVEGAFESAPVEAGAYALVVAATAWSWVEPAVRYQRAAFVLRPGGHLAFWDAQHVVPEDGDPFFAELQDVYDEINESLPPGAVWLRPGEVPERRDEIEASGRFEVVDVRQFDWEVTYDAEGYVALLSTFSGHIEMEDWQRDRLFDEIRRRLAARPDGRLRRHWGAALHVARRT